MSAALAAACSAARRLSTSAGGAFAANGLCVGQNGLITGMTQGTGCTAADEDDDGRAAMGTAGITSSIGKTGGAEATATDATADGDG